MYIKLVMRFVASSARCAESRFSDVQEMRRNMRGARRHDRRNVKVDSQSRLGDLGVCRSLYRLFGGGGARVGRARRRTIATCGKNAEQKAQAGPIDARRCTVPSSQANTFANGFPTKGSDESDQ